MRLDKRSVVLCIVLMVISFVIFCPGKLSYDSHHQMWGAQHKIYSIQHPAIMAFLGSKLLLFKERQLLMFLFQIISYFTLIYFFTLKIKNKTIRNITPLLFLFPPIFGFIGVIWKDIHLGLAFFSLFLLLDRNIKRTKFLWVIIILISIYGLAVRYNSVLAALPFVFYCLYYLNKKDKFDFLYVFLKSSAITLALFLFAQSINSVLTWKEHNYLQKQYLHMFDIAAISIATDTNYFPDEIKKRPDFSFEKIKEKFTYVDANSITYSYLGLVSHYSIPIEKAWKRVILSEPIEYIKQRFLLFANATGFFKKHQYTHHYSTGKYFTGLQQRVGTFLKWQKDAFYYNYWFIFFISLFLIYVSYVKKVELLPEIFCLGASGFLYTTLYLAIGISSDYRLLWWSILCYFLAGIISVDQILVVYKKKRNIPVI